MDVAIGGNATPGKNRMTWTLVLPESIAKNSTSDEQPSATRYYHDSLAEAEVQFSSESSSLVSLGTTKEE